MDIVDVYEKELVELLVSCVIEVTQSNDPIPTYALFMFDALWLPSASTVHRVNVWPGIKSIPRTIARLVIFDLINIYIFQIT